MTYSMMTTRTVTALTMTALLLPALLVGCGDTIPETELPGDIDLAAVDMRTELDTSDHTWITRGQRHSAEVCENDKPGHDHDHELAEVGRILDGPRTTGHPSARARLARLGNTPITPRTVDPGDPIFELQQDFLDLGCADDLDRDPACDGHGYKQLIREL
jgi:hypothetical protein